MFLNERKRYKFRYAGLDVKETQHGIKIFRQDYANSLESSVDIRKMDTR